MRSTNNMHRIEINKGRTHVQRNISFIRVRIYPLSFDLISFDDSSARDVHRLDNFSTIIFVQSSEMRELRKR